jgi:hypothetical protein
MRREQRIIRSEIEEGRTKKNFVKSNNNQLIKERIEENLISNKQK